MTISQELATRLEGWHRTAILEHPTAQEFAHAFIASGDADGLEDGWDAIEAACRALYAELRAEYGARRVTKRSELRECVVTDSCGGLLTPDGEYVLAATCWGVGAEYGGRREYWRLDGRTVISLPVVA